MEPHCVILIRHAEKPSADGSSPGLAPSGESDPHELSLEGWQRAGALTCFFSPWHEGLTRAQAPPPNALFAPRPSELHPSRRGLRTLQPLAARLGLRVRTPHAVGEETMLADRLRTASGVVLVAWEHRALPGLARALVGHAGCDRPLPTVWPGDRFDVLWLFMPSEAGWHFWQQPQNVMAGGRLDTF